MAARSIKYEKRKQTISSTDPDHYQVRTRPTHRVEHRAHSTFRTSQKVTAFSRAESSPLLAVGSTNSELSLLSYPALDEVLPTLTYDGEEIYDADFNDDGDMVRCCLTSSPLACLS